MEVSVMDGDRMQLPDDVELDRVSVSAAKTKDDRLFISLINLQHEGSEEISLDLKGSKHWKVEEVRQLSAPSVDSVNSFETPDAIEPVTLQGKDFSIDETIILPALSVTTVMLK